MRTTCSKLGSTVHVQHKLRRVANHALDCPVPISLVRRTYSLASWESGDDEACKGASQRWSSLMGGESISVQDTNVMTRGIAIVDSKDVRTAYGVLLRTQWAAQPDPPTRIYVSSSSALG